MRANGVPNFPDPGLSISGPSNGIGGIEIPTTINARAPAFQAAEKACAKLQPGAVVSASSPSASTERVIRAGASGFLARDTPIDEIVTALRAAAADSRRLVPHAVEEVLAALQTRDGPEQQHPGVDRLSPRQLAVLRLISRGLDNEEIADMIRTNPRKAQQLVSSILEKLGPPDR